MLLSTRNPKIFGIGLPRTGTTSLYFAMQQLGFKSVHYPKTIELLYECEFANDLTVSSRYKRLDRAFPKSKFIYTYRPSESWLVSIKRHYASIRFQQNQFREQSHIDIFGDRIANLYKLTDQQWLTSYHQFDQGVGNYFASRDDLLIIDPFNEDNTYTKLVGFLERWGFLKYPHTNKSK